MKKIISCLLAAVMLTGLLPFARAADEQAQNPRTASREALLSGEASVFILTEDDAVPGGNYKFRAVCDPSLLSEEEIPAGYTWRIAYPAESECSDLFYTSESCQDFTVSKEYAVNGFSIQCRILTEDGGELLTGKCLVYLSPVLTQAGSRMILVDKNTSEEQSGQVYCKISAEVMPDREGLSFSWYALDMDGNETLLEGLDSAALTDALIPAKHVENGDLLFCRAATSDGHTTDSEPFELRFIENADFSVKAYKTVLDNADLNEDGKYLFRLAAFGTDNEAYRYCWEYRNTGSEVWLPAQNLTEEEDEAEFCFGEEDATVFDGIAFRCVAYYDDIACFSSNELTICAAPRITLDLPEKYLVDTGALTVPDAVYPMTFHIEAVSSGEVTRQWHCLCGEEELAWDVLGSVTGENTDTLTAEVKAAFLLTRPELLFCCEVTDQNGCGSFSTKTALIYIDPPLITSDLPENYVYGRNEYDAETGTLSGHRFSVTAQGSELRYEWYISLDNGKTWQKEDCTESEFTPAIPENSLSEDKCFLIKAVIYDTDTAKTESTVCRASGVPHILRDLPALLYTDTDALEQTEGENFYRVDAEINAVSAQRLTYKWFYWDSAAEKKAYKQLDGFDTAVIRGALIPEAAVIRTSYLRCEITDEEGHTVTSSAARLIPVHKAGISLPESFSVLDSQLTNGIYEYTLKASSSHKENAPVSYTWYIGDGAGGWTKTGTDSPELRLSLTREQLLRTVSIKCAATVYSALTTESNVCVIDMAPYFTSAPAAEISAAGDSGTLTAYGTASGELTYKWLYSPDDLHWFEISDSDKYTGADTPVLTVHALAEKDYTLWYRVRITDGRNGLYSAHIGFEKPAINITLQPSDAKTAIGQTAVFKVKAEGMGLTYKWTCKTPAAKTWITPVYSTAMIPEGENTSTLKITVNSKTAYNYIFRCTVSDGTNLLYSRTVKLIPAENEAPDKPDVENDDPGNKPGEKDSVLPGDVDLNGRVEAADARLALRASVALEYYAPASEEFRAADADKNGKLEAADARLILRAAVGLEKLK